MKTRMVSGSQNHSYITKICHELSRCCFQLRCGQASRLAVALHEAILGQAEIGFDPSFVTSKFEVLCTALYTHPIASTFGMEM